MERRTWFYLQQPNSFAIGPCKCGNDDIQWSEFKGHVWCDVCKIDFVPEDNGIFDGPIPIQTVTMLGVSFDRFNIETNRVERLNIDDMNYYEEK